jgi:hypothetical protein
MYPHLDKYLVKYSKIKFTFVFTVFMPVKVVMTIKYNLVQTP